MNILKGERYYASKNYNQAYTYLNEADNFQTLIGAPATHLKMMNETIEYESIMSSSDVSKVKSYLNALSTSSPFYVPTSNKIALLLGSALSMYSSEYSMNEALVYAKDDNTRAAVKRYISKAKADKAYYERQRKKMHIKGGGAKISKLVLMQISALILMEIQEQICSIQQVCCYALVMLIMCLVW